MAIEILNNCHFDSNKIRTLYIGSRLTNGDPISYPIEYLTVSGSTDSIIKIEAWNDVSGTVTLGGQEIQVNEITNTGDNITFTEDMVIDNNGKRYQKNITFTIPKLTLFLINQLREFVMTNTGQFALSPTIAFLVDDNGQTLVVGYDKFLVLQNKDLKLGENDNEVTLSYQSNSYSRARAYQVL
jgi:hypothetical protein